jgi:hypothetical protein
VLFVQLMFFCFVPVLIVLYALYMATADFEVRPHMRPYDNQELAQQLSTGLLPNVLRSSGSGGFYIGVVLICYYLLYVFYFNFFSWGRG